MTSRWLNAALLATALVCATGCAEIAPWERGTLAKSQMALVPNPVRNAQRAHTFAAREAAASSGSQEGGGCGCN